MVRHSQLPRMAHTLRLQSASRSSACMPWFKRHTGGAYGNTSFYGLAVGCVALVICAITLHLVQPQFLQLTPRLVYIKQPPRPISASGPGSGLSMPHEEAALDSDPYHHDQVASHRVTRASSQGLEASPGTESDTLTQAAAGPEVHHSVCGVGTSEEQRDCETRAASRKLPFRIPESPGAWTYEDMRWCPGSLEPPAAEVPPVDPRLRMLMVIGAQKAGTSWLHHALATHPSMVQGITQAVTRRNTTWQGKELQFFSRWPTLGTEEFLNMWPEDELEGMINGTSRKFLIDASPEYLMMPASPPRIKQIIPQARIVIVLRDPTERSFSSWSMRHRAGAHCRYPELGGAITCVQPTFLETFVMFKRRAEFELRPECEFKTEGAGVTWGDCFSCLFTSYQNATCMERMRAGDDVFPCTRKQADVFDYSTYAPQIAWWLQFFPPEQIFITTADALRHQEVRIQVLNRLLDFVGLEDVPRVNRDKVDEASGFRGDYSISAEDEAIRAVMRHYYASQTEDVRALLSTVKFPPENLWLMGYPLPE